MKSIITDDLNVCFLCGSYDRVEVHHCIHGSANRRLATKYKLLVGLCWACHHGTYGAHGTKGHETDLHLQKIAQRKWEEKHGSREDWIRIFGKSYL